MQSSHQGGNAQCQSIPTQCYLPKQHLPYLMLVLFRDLLVGLCVGVDPVHCDLISLDAPSMRILDAGEVREGVEGVLGHYCAGLCFEEGAEGVVEGAFDAVHWVLVERDGIKVSVQVHVGAIGREDVDEVA